MAKLVLFLSSKTEDGDVITDGQAYDDENEAVEAIIETRAAEGELSKLFGGPPFEITGRLYKGDPSVDDELTFYKEV